MKWCGMQRDRGLWLPLQAECYGFGCPERQYEASIARKRNKTGEKRSEIWWEAVWSSTIYQGLSRYMKTCVTTWWIHRAESQRDSNYQQRRDEQRLNYHRGIKPSFRTFRCYLPELTMAQRRGSCDRNQAWSCERLLPKVVFPSTCRHVTYLTAPVWTERLVQYINGS